MQACTSLHVDLIALDLGRRLPFRLRPASLQAAVKRGLHFELCYASALRDEASRRNFFANATGVEFCFPFAHCTHWRLQTDACTHAAALCRATRGRGVILSSGARSAFELRGPYDAMNLGALLGLTEQQAKVCLRCFVAVVLHCL